MFHNSVYRRDYKLKKNRQRFFCRFKGRFTPIQLLLEKAAKLYKMFIIQMQGLHCHW